MSYKMPSTSTAQPDGSSMYYVLSTACEERVSTQLFAKMVARILLVGTGITSALTASLLRQRCHQQIQLVVWDKAKGTGGRMSTSRSPTDSTCIADLGAQYITSLPDNLLNHIDIYNSLITAGVLEPLSATVEGIKEFPSGTKHFVAPSGMSSIVKHFFKNAVPEETHFDRHITSINKRDTKWEVATLAGVKELFDAVILTMPVPQIQQLTGTVQEIISATPAVKNGLNETKYSSRYALGLFHNDKSRAKLNDVMWDVKYLSDSKIFRYVAFDNKKRNRSDEPTAIVFHTSISFGEENIERSLSDVEIPLLEEVKRLFPELPEPAAVKCHKWRFSQVLTPYPGKPGFVILGQSPLLIAGGDGFVASGLDGCITSAIKLTDQVVASMLI